jgi:hypothetical protein
MCYYINNVEQRFLIPNADRFWYARGLRSSDRFLYNYMMNLLLCSQSILGEWLWDSTWCIMRAFMRARARVCVCVCVCARCSSYRLIFRKAIMLNLFKVVSPSDPTKVTLLALPPLTKCRRRCCKYCVRSANVFQMIAKVCSWNAVSEELSIVSIA